MNSWFPQTELRGARRDKKMYTLLHNIRIVAVEPARFLDIAVNGAIDELNNVEYAAHFADTNRRLGSGFNLRNMQFNVCWRSAPIPANAA